MTISRAQMYRQLYQVGGMSGMGIESLSPMQPAMQPAMQSAMYTPLENTYYSGMPMMANGGRIGYQEGDMAMSQPEGIMGAMPGAMQPEAGGMMQPPMQGQLGEGDNALLTIIQLLIEQGVPPEQAQELARQILQIFAQGGEPAVEEFANQLEQQEGMQEMAMMANGGIMSYAQRQGYGFGGKLFKAVTGGIGSAVKGVSNAIKSVAKSPIGKIALTIGATMLMGPAGFNLAAGQFGVTNAFLAGAINAGAANLLVQGITTGKINPKEALLASALGGATGYFNPGSTGVPSASGTVDAFGNITSTSASGNVITTPPASTLTSNLNQNIAPTMGLTIPGDVNQLASVSNPLITPSVSYPGLSTTSPLLGSSDMVPKPEFFETASAVAKDPSLSGIKSLAQQGLSSLYDTAKENIVPLGLGFAAGAGIRPQAADESDEDYQRYLTNRNAEVARFEDLYRTGIRGVQAANGGRIGYEGGSMPMGEPRRNPAGIMELDYRAKGGFVPPIGIKEKEDDIPAMLSNNEFVFTADAVRNAGGGNVNKGAQRMYGLMKQLEAGGVV